MMGIIQIQRDEILAQRSKSSRSLAIKEKDPVFLVNQVKKQEEGWNKRFIVEKAPINRVITSGPPEGGISKGYVLPSPKQKKNEDNELVELLGMTKNTGIRQIRSAKSLSRTAMSRPQTAHKFASNDIGNKQAFIIRKKYMNTLDSNPINDLISKYKAEDVNPDKREILVTTLQKSLEDEWKANEIPQFQRELILNLTKNNLPEKVIKVFRKELDTLKTKTAPAYGLEKAILARENCLIELFKLNETLQDEIMKGEGLVPVNELDEYLSKASELLTHLRILTIASVEGIDRWRHLMQSYYNIINDSFPSVYPIYFSYMKEDKNYLLKLMSDTLELYLSPLSEFFNFSEHEDPFLIVPSRESEIIGEQQRILYLSKPIMSRIEKITHLLEEEREYHRKKSSKQENFVQRVIASPKKTPINQRPLSGPATKYRDIFKQEELVPMQFGRRTNTESLL